jgi:UDP-N-acetylmuramate--alanine ligase
MEELRVLFGDFLRVSKHVTVNADDPEALALAPEGALTFGMDNPSAAISANGFSDGPTSLAATVIADRTSYELQLAMPGRHNLANALAAIAGAHAAGVPVANAVAALASFKGLARRFDILGTSASGVTVIDDFAHNPEKCRATLRTLKAHPGRVIAFFQPHGDGPLMQMGEELAEVFAYELDASDIAVMCDPVYFGGTVDRSEGSERIIGLIRNAGGNALYLPTRDECGAYMLDIAGPGDRLVVMGARDDTLTTFAKDILARLA